MNTDSIVAALKRLLIPFYGTASDLKTAAQAWYKQYLELKNTPDHLLSRELLTEKRDLINRGNSIIEKIESLGLGADALQQNLGALPLLAVGVIVTAASLMLYWTYDFIKFRDKLNEYKSMRQSGMSHSQANEVIKSIDSGIFSSLEGTAKYLTIAGAGIGLFLLAKKMRWIK